MPLRLNKEVKIKRDRIKIKIVKKIINKAEKKKNKSYHNYEINHQI